MEKEFKRSDINLDLMPIKVIATAKEQILGQEVSNVIPSFWLRSIYLLEDVER